MAAGFTDALAALAALALLRSSSCAVWSACPARARTETGWACGARHSFADTVFASFKGIPYAKQPVGELRFAELQPAEPWAEELDAREEGPVCPQFDPLYKTLACPHGMSEACITVNVHVPLAHLPGASNGSRARPLPVLVFVHGGGFAFGSGDSDLHGPEYLVHKTVVVTFNYRVGPFGFLSLGTQSIPGNAGLRDMVTLLRWVQRNIHYFGGNPDDVTLAGQSAGAAAVHLLSLSESTEGLFKRIIMMSGVGVRSFFSPSPAYAALMAGKFLGLLGVNGSEPEAAARALRAAPLADVLAAHERLVNEMGYVVFAPVVEAARPGLTPVLDADPEALLAAGRGRDVQAIIGFTEGECESHVDRFNEIDLMQKIKVNPLLLVPPPLIFKNMPKTLASKIGQIKQHSFPNLTVDSYVDYCTKSLFVYPALYVARRMAERHASPVFLYQFSYRGAVRVFVPGRPAARAAHVEDLTYIFRTNSMSKKMLRKREVGRDGDMILFMTSLFEKFIQSDNPSGSAPWNQTDERLSYLDIREPHRLRAETPGPGLQRDIRFFDDLYADAAPALPENTRPAR